jgi:hypothetical protein
MKRVDNARPRTVKYPRSWALGLAIVALASLPCDANLLNGTFDTDLNGWTIVGDVTAGPEASVGDAGFDYSLLYQGLPLTPGQYRLEFDFLNLLSGDLSASPSAFPDTFYASLFFIDVLGNFDLPNGVFDDVSALVDLDSAGPFNVAGTLGTSALGGNWIHFTYDFVNAYNYAIPAFELLDFNGITNDSLVQVDNVSVLPQTSVVPEPATIALLFMGLVGGVATRKRNA